jgi:hypothetical protein
MNVLHVKLIYLISKLHKDEYMRCNCEPLLDEKTQSVEIYLKREDDLDGQLPAFCIDANDKLKYGIRNFFPCSFEGEGSGPAVYHYFDSYTDMVKEWNERVKKWHEDAEFYTDTKYKMKKHMALYEVRYEENRKQLKEEECEERKKRRQNEIYIELLKNNNLY